MMEAIPFVGSIILAALIIIGLPHKARIASILAIVTIVIVLSFVTGRNLIWPLIVLVSLFVGIIYLIKLIDAAVTPVVVRHFRRLYTPIWRSIRSVGRHDGASVLRGIVVAEKWITDLVQPRKHPRWRFFSVLFLIFLLLTIAIYHPLLQSYFIQDEWYYFGLFNQFVEKPLGMIDIFVQQFSRPNLYGIHFTPLWNTAFFLEYQLFGLTYPPYMILSMLLHATTATLVAFLADRLGGKRIYALLGGAFFTVVFSHNEAVYWANTHIQTQVTTMLAIVAILLWHRGLQGRRPRALVGALIITGIGLLFKETIFALLPLFICMALIYKAKRLHWLSIGLVALSVAVYLPFRVVLAKVLTARDVSLQTAPIVPAGIFDIAAQTYRLVTYPLKAIAQTLLPTEVITVFAEQMTGWTYPTYAAEQETRGSQFLTFAQSAGSDMVMIYVSMLFIVFVLITYITVIRSSTRNVQTMFLLAVSVVVATIIPLLFIAPWLSKLFAFVTFIDSRHLYLSSVGMSLVLTLAILSISVWLYRIAPKVIAVRVAGGIAVMMLVYLSFYNYQSVKKVAAVGKERKAIVTAVTTTFPSIDDKALFYIQSNKPYYGLGTPIPPYQTNFGYTLLDVYFKQKQYDPEFYTSGFLLKKGLDGEEYREYNGKGFGYALTEKNLTKMVASSGLTADNVYAFAYDGTAKQTTNITPQVRQKVAAFFEAERAYQDWQAYDDEVLGIRFSHPPGTFVVEEPTIDPMVKQLFLRAPSGQTILSLIVYKKPDTIGLRGFSETIKDSQGNTYGPSKDTSLVASYGDAWPAITTETPYETAILFNTKSNAQMKVLTFFNTYETANFPLQMFYNRLEFYKD